MNGSGSFLLDIPADFRWEAVPPAVAAAAASAALDVDRLADLGTAVAEAVGVAITIPASDRVVIEGTPDDGRLELRITATGAAVDDEDMASVRGSVAWHVLESLVGNVAIEHGQGRVEIRFSCRV